MQHQPIQEQKMPLSGEAIRTMNYVDDMSVTLRRILAVLPSLTEEERQRVAQHIKESTPSYESVVTAVGQPK
jgi:hypothetical protein